VRRSFLRLVNLSLPHSGASKESQDESLEQLLDDFDRLRRENLAALQALNLQQEDLTRRGR